MGRKKKEPETLAQVFGEEPPEPVQVELVPAESLPYEDMLIALDELPENSKIISPEPTPDFVRNIKARGVIMPILIRRVMGGLHIIAGKRRVKAARAAGKTHIPARLFGDLGLWDALTMETADNACRRSNDLSDLLVLKELKAHNQPLSLSMLPKGTIRKRMKIIGLEAAFLQAIIDGNLSMSTAESLATLSQTERQPFLDEISQGKKVTGKEVAKARWARTLSASQQASLPDEEFEYDARSLFIVLENDLTAKHKKFNPFRSYDEAQRFTGKSGRVFKLVEM